MTTNEPIQATKTKEEIKSSNIKVLHIDDSVEFLEITAEFLNRKNNDIEVEMMHDPAHALRRIKQENFTCVVSDCTMPGMDLDGFELHQEIRRTNDDLAFVFFTGRSEEEIPDEILNHESTRYLQKEIDIGQYNRLANLIRETVR